MPGLFAETSSENLNKMVQSSISSVLMQSSSTCTSQTSTDQELRWSDLTINASGKCIVKWDNIDQTANVAPNMSCAQTVSNSANLQTDLKTKLQQNAKAIASGLPNGVISKVSTKNVNDICNQISNSVNMEALASCVQSTLSRQSAEWSNFKINCVDDAVIEWTNITQTIVANAAMKCTQDIKGIADLVTQLSNELSQTADSEDKGIDLGGILMGVAMAVIAVIMVITMFRGSKSGNTGDSSSSSSSMFDLPPVSLPTLPPHV